MGVSRQQAIKRIAGLSVKVRVHLDKIGPDAAAPVARHWRHEVESWMTQIEQAARHVGTRTRSDVLKQLAVWQRDLGDLL